MRGQLHRLRGLTRISLRSIRAAREIFLDVYLNPQSRRHTPLPSKEEVLAFIGKEAGNVGTREIARAFGLKNADRAALKQMLRDLADEGAIEKRRKKLHRAGALPEVWCSQTSPPATPTAS